MQRKVTLISMNNLLHAPDEVIYVSAMECQSKRFTAIAGVCRLNNSECPCRAETWKRGKLKPPGGSLLARDEPPGDWLDGPVSPGVRCLPSIRRPPPSRHAGLRTSRRKPQWMEPHARAGDRTAGRVTTDRARQCVGGTAASGQPPRESYCYACCWTTSFPALRRGYASPRRAGK